jgi:hypothetical protein
VGIATLVAVAVMCVPALAMNPYTVHLGLPSSVKKGSTFDLRVYGYSANTSKLAVFHDNQVCAATAAHEHAHASAMQFIAKKVTGAYSASGAGKAVATGTHYICAYLTGLPPQSLPRAHAMASYTVS